MKDVEFRQDNPVTEFGLVKLGGNDNYLKDTLDSSITNRISGDAAITGAGPYGTMTATTARLANCRQHVKLSFGITAVVGVIRNMSGIRNPNTSISALPEYQFVWMSVDRGSFRVEQHYQNTPNADIERTVLVTGGSSIAVSNRSWATFQWNSTFANMFGNLELFLSYDV
ncbi:MAG: hypothetical protein HC902_07625 [Calothrix sp. SM1_5_4]|nr:hypothetical protein [Calothrix sp. SM1_5_4]